MKPFHLHSAYPVCRHHRSTTQRQYALREPEMPKGNGTPRALHEIFNYLQDSERYKHTFPEKDLSGLYLYDVAYLAGAYVPRIWYSNVKLPSPLNIRILNNNDLYEWFTDHSANFGWEEISDIKLAQQYAGVGHLVTIAASPKNKRMSGRFTIVVPDLQMEKPAAIPTQAKPGGFFQHDWYKHKKYESYKIYVNFFK